jgi:hypothetical protein
MWMLLTTPACTVGLDWTRPPVPDDAALQDGPTSPDRPRGNDAADTGAVDTGAVDTGAVDTGFVDTGPGTMGNCGDQGQRCCGFGICSSGRVCVTGPAPMMSRTCESCGGDNQRCCAFGFCGNGRFCTQRAGDPTPLCRECGGMGEQCCFNRSCSNDRRCETRPGAPYPTCQ